MSLRQYVAIAMFAVGGGLLGASAPARCQEMTPVEAASSSPAAGSVERRPIRSGERERIEALWGIKVESLRLTAAGYMLDFRFTVIDPTKAEPLFDRKAQPILTDEKSGTVVTVPTPPKTGPLRSSNDPKEGRTYFMFFGNPGHFVQRYNSVTITVGDFSISGLVVK